MSGPAEMLREVPPNFTLFAGILLGSVILVCLVVFHGMGIHWVIGFHRRGNARLCSGRPHVVRAILLFGTAIFFLLALHILGVIWWAIVLTHLGLVRTAKDAIYFCANAYTTLGYGQVDLDPAYRIISPIIGLSGLFTFAWTTSALVNIVSAHNALIQQLEEERTKEKELRANLRLEIQDVHARERAAERSEKADFAHESAAGSFLRYCRLWREERQKLKSVRASARGQVKDLARDEREAEDNLGASQPPAPSSPPAPEAKHVNSSKS